MGVPGAQGVGAQGALSRVGLVDDGLAGLIIRQPLYGLIINQPLNFNLPRKKMTKGY